MCIGKSTLIAIITSIALGSISAFAQQADQPQTPESWKNRGVSVQKPFRKQVDLKSANRSEYQGPLDKVHYQNTDQHEAQTPKAQYPLTLNGDSPVRSQPDQNIDASRYPQQLNADTVAKAPAPVQHLVQIESTGPLDQYVINTSGITTEPKMAPVPTDARELTGSPTGTTVLTRDIPKQLIQHQPQPVRQTVVESGIKQSPGSVHQVIDPTEHIHAHARYARETLDPAQCGHRLPPSRDISGCYDEWQGFCAPRNLDWECGCDTFPRRDGARNCYGSRACQKCQPVRRCQRCDQRTNGPCGCNTRGPIKRILKAIPACGKCGSHRADCGCNGVSSTQIQSSIPGLGLFKPTQFTRPLPPLPSDNDYFAGTEENRYERVQVPSTADASGQFDTSTIKR